ncbi:MAG: JDVT-CTERM system glutamic-type intramembrane protease [Aquincola sp.]|nr:JDVT-CTERM system glutamic-type intramembrane protease [Aquincola sp.]MDH5331760.1 JDVT-CTERM system glutamic-type intramembrane protease [Aquincola sp.]
MAHDADRRPPSTWPREYGLVRPDGGAWIWLSDTHVLAALAAAAPVWALLVMTVGDRMHVTTGWAGWITLVLAQPLIEEIVFRGVLQGQLLQMGLSRRHGPFTNANLVTTVCFVGAHLFTQPPAWALAVSVPSLVFGHLRERFGSVWPAVFVHAIYNAGFALAAWWVHA